MKKVLSIILVCVLGATFITSCTNPTKVLPGHGGKWTVAYTVVTTVGSMNNTSTGSDTWTFTNDGKVSTTSNGTSSTSNWSYNKDAETMTITANNNSSTVYSVTEKKAKEEKWHYSDSGSSGGVSYSDVVDLILTRQ